MTQNLTVNEQDFLNGIMSDSRKTSLMFAVSLLTFLLAIIWGAIYIEKLFLIAIMGFPVFIGFICFLRKSITTFKINEILEITGELNVQISNKTGNIDFVVNDKIFQFPKHWVPFLLIGETIKIKIACLRSIFGSNWFCDLFNGKKRDVVLSVNDQFMIDREVDKGLSHLKPIVPCFINSLIYFFYAITAGFIYLFSSNNTLLVISLILVLVANIYLGFAIKHIFLKNRIYDDLMDSDYFQNIVGS